MGDVRVSDGTAEINRSFGCSNSREQDLLSNFLALFVFVLGHSVVDVCKIQKTPRVQGAGCRGVGGVGCRVSVVCFLFCG